MCSFSALSAAMFFNFSFISALSRALPSASPSARALLICASKSARSSSRIGLDISDRELLLPAPRHLSPQHLLLDSAARRAGWRLVSRSLAMRKLCRNRQIGKMQSLQAGISPRCGCGGLKTPRATRGSWRAGTPDRVARPKQVGLQVLLAGVVACPCRGKDGLKNAFSGEKGVRPPPAGT